MRDARTELNKSCELRYYSNSNTSMRYFAVKKKINCLQIVKIGRQVIAISFTSQSYLKKDNSILRNVLRVLTCFTVYPNTLCQNHFTMFRYLVNVLVLVTIISSSFRLVNYLAAILLLNTRFNYTLLRYKFDFYGAHNPEFQVRGALSWLTGSN